MTVCTCVSACSKLEPPEGSNQNRIGGLPAIRPSVRPTPQVVNDSVALLLEIDSRSVYYRY